MAKLTKTELQAFAEDLVNKLNIKIKEHNENVMSTKKYKDAIKKVKQETGILEAEDIMKKFNKKYPKVTLSMSAGYSYSEGSPSYKLREVEKNFIKSYLTSDDINNVTRKLIIAQSTSKGIENVCSDIESELLKKLDI